MSLLRAALIDVPRILLGLACDVIDRRICRWANETGDET